MKKNSGTTVSAYVIFFMTGVAVMTPGILLPMLTARWRMGDSAAGILFLCFSIASSCGALLARGKLAWTLGTGCALAAAGAVLLVGPTRPQWSIAVYGLGLGLSMTSISLLRSRLYPRTRISEFARLNLTWALGAGLAPAALLRCASIFGVAAVFHALALCFAAFAALAFSIFPVASSPDRTGSARWFTGLRMVPLVLLCMVPLTTGIESGTANWLSSYVLRDSHLLSVTIRATAAFGLGLITGRLAYSRSGRPERLQRRILQLHPAITLAGLLLLVLSQTPFASVCAALLIGFGIGPMYPLALALLLDYNEAGNIGFFAGGFGASVLPMLTGAVSGKTHSLRTGLLVLLVSAAVMAVLGWLTPVKQDG